MTRTLSALFVYLSASGLVLLAAQTASARPTALASADFDGDGMPDLVVGYANDGGGAIVLHRGNVDALFPNAPEARRRRAEGTFEERAFLPGPRTVTLDFAVDFLGAGDFDNDGHQDLLAATRGGTSLHLLRGDGRGGLSLADDIGLEGRLDAMAIGDVNKADGIPDVVVGLSGDSGSSLVVFESPRGVVASNPETVQLPAPPTLLALGRIRNTAFVDIVAAAGENLFIVEGRELLQRVSLPSSVESLAWGNFLWEATPREELAITTADGRLVFADLEETNGSMALKRVESERPFAAGTTLFPARLSGLSTQDLLILEPADRPVQAISGLRRPDTQGGDAGPAGVELAGLGRWSYPSLNGRPLAVLAMRLNADARPDLVVVQEGVPDATLAITAPQSVIAVNSNSDVAAAGDGACTLREAINNSNANADTTGGDCAAGAGLDTITFSIGGGGSVATIAVTGSGLPAITDSVSIDGTSQGCASPPCIEINGAAAGAGIPGLRLTAGGNTVRGLVINRATHAGIYVTSSGNIVEGNRAGTNVSGTVDLGNAASGIQLTGSGVTFNTIGGTVAAARNLLSGNETFGVSLGAGSSNNQVLGNYIGVDATGTAAIGNTFQGVLITGVSFSNVIGGASPGARNVIAGNVLNGVAISNSSSNQVLGNYIGVDPTGTVAIRNLVHGVGLTNSAVANVIGGVATAARNVVSGNGQDGVAILNSSSQNEVLGNFIGVDPTGTVALGNGWNAVELQNSGVNTIGGAVPGAGNVLSASVLYNGVMIGVSDETVVQGNLIGTDASGTIAFGNQAGVRSYGSRLCTIGGTTPGARNVISGNLGNGVDLDNSSDNTLSGNYIGTDVTGTAAVPNQRIGVWVYQSGYNVIGGTVAGAGNVISANGVAGGYPGIQVQTTSEGNTIQGNLVGTDVTGAVALGNAGSGVAFLDTGANLVGGTVPGAGNVVAGNALTGVSINSSTGVVVHGNSIGTDSTGTVALGNGVMGVRVRDSMGARIGGNLAGEGNRIVNNGEAGVIVHGTSTGSRILGNAIAGNGLLGIELGESDGVTGNDPGDADAGPNELQNFPVLASVQSSPGGVVVVGGSLESTPATGFRLEFFSSQSCDASGHGEGGRFLGATDVTTDGLGSAPFSVSLAAPVAAGEMVTATATSATNSTSELSACAAASCSSVGVFPFAVLASDEDHLTWGTTADVRWVKGDLAQVGSYQTLANGTMLGASGLDIAADQPTPGTGLYYLVRPLICGSWQSALGGEPGRDSVLP